MHPDFGKFLCLAPKNSDFAIFSHYCFFNNFLLKSQNNVPLILELPLKLVIYNFAFDSILPFLVKFGILPPNLIISAN